MKLLQVGNEQEKKLNFTCGIFAIASIQTNLLCEKSHGDFVCG